MKVSYEYKGHKCPFKANVWNGPTEYAKRKTVVAVVEGANCPFKTVDLDATGEVGSYRCCGPITDPKVIPWTPDKVPSGIEIYDPKWTKDVRVTPIAILKCGIAYYNGDDEDIYVMSYPALVEHDWKIYGTDEPCGEVVA